MVCRFRGSAFCSVRLADAIWSGILASLQDCAPRHQIRELHDSGRLGVNWRVAEHFPKSIFCTFFITEGGEDESCFELQENTYSPWVAQVSRRVWRCPVEAHWYGPRMQDERPNSTSGCGGYCADNGTRGTLERLWWKGGCLGSWHVFVHVCGLHGPLVQSSWLFTYGRGPNSRSIGWSESEAQLSREAMEFEAAWRQRLGGGSLSGWSNSTSQGQTNHEHQ